MEPIIEYYKCAICGVKWKSDSSDFNEEDFVIPEDEFILEDCGQHKILELNQED